jgi:FKBP-type peptidyl-prolyl cis-trans isomerase FklB
MKPVLITTAVGLALVNGLCAAGQKVELKEENDRVNYSVGYQIGGDFRRQGVEMNAEALVQGIRDALSGAQPMMSPEEMNTTLKELKKRIVTAERERRAEAARKNRADAESFMTENGKRQGVQTLPSGLQYRVIAEGTGETPKASDTVTVHYRGTLIDGTEFDSSYRRNKPATFGVSRVIPGWTEALQLMRAGDKWELYIPPKLAYGERGAGAKIPPNSALIFEVELISIN